MSDLTVANTIKEQIGHKALYMLGAKNLLGDSNSLQFSIRGSKKANMIKITLNSMDTYDMKFMKVGRSNFKVVCEHNGVYDDMLHNLIEKETGLYTSL